MIDMRHGTLPTQVEANWQLDFLARWKAKHSIYSEGAIELDGYPVLSPEGGFSEEQIRRINTAILNQVGPNQDSLRHLHQAGRSGNGDSWYGDRADRVVVTARLGVQCPRTTWSVGVA
jgi:hypothetical protein